MIIDIIDSPLNRIVMYIMLSLPLYFIILFSSISNLEQSKEDVIIKNKLMIENKWLTDNLYDLYYYRSKEYNVNINLAIAIIRAESNGRNVVSRRNKNGTRDYGRMQINGIHFPKNPRKLLNDKINSKYGFWYISYCLRESDGNIKKAIRLYNQGVHGKAKYYTNWKYVYKILDYYKGV